MTTYDSSAIEVLIGRTYATAGDSEWNTTEKVDRGDYLEMTGLVHNKTYNEELPVVWLYPKKWNGRVILWLDDRSCQPWSGKRRTEATVNT